MSRLLYLLAIVLAAGVGFLIGRTDLVGRGGRGAGGVVERGPDRRVVSLPAQEVVELRQRAAAVVEVAEENERLRAEVARLESELEPKPGERRKDASIVGGARWNESFVQMATGFIDSMLAFFLREANLTPEQEKRLRAELEVRFGQALAITADFTNGDVEADNAYDLLETNYKDALKLLHTMLDEKQIEAYRRFERNTKNIMRSQIVHQELAVLKKELRLDSEQEKKIKEIVEARYGRVQEGYLLPIPNVYFKPIRRDKDKAIYDETATRIRELLRPEQVPLFNRYELAAPTAPFAFRNMLVPRR